jgi:hypothetical protein
MYNKNMKIEQKLNTILNQYLREKRMYCFYELKQTKAKTFPFSKIETVQWEGLQSTEKNGLVWKISDETSRPKPCDGISIPPLPSYLIIFFPRIFCFIRFSDILNLKNEGFISISKEKAEKIAERKLIIN